MEKTTKLFLILFFLASCSVKNDCQNRFDYVSCNDSIPILKTDLSKPYQTIRKEMSGLYGSDVCKKCSRIDFRLPFNIEGEKGYLKVMGDFGSPFCDNCPPFCGLRYDFSIHILHNNLLLTEGELTEMDSLKSKIEIYLAKVGKDENAPEKFDLVNIRLRWDRKADPAYLNEVLTVIYKSYLSFIESELKKAGKDFCAMDKAIIADLKTQYPLRIELDLGKGEKMEQMLLDNYNNRHFLDSLDK